MKKLIITIVTALICVCANAQYINPSDSEVSMKLLAEQDASDFYNGRGACLGAIYPVSIVLSPLGGAIPALIGSTSKVKVENLNCPRPELYRDNLEYRKYYNEKCQKIKSKKAWVNYGIAALTGFIINYTIITSVN